MSTLKKISIQNFKSIREQTLELGQINIFIGGNGSGKSNLIESFRFLREIVYKDLQSYTEKRGGADALLHFGRKRSPSMSFTLEFPRTSQTSNYYSAQLFGTDDGRLTISDFAYYHDNSKYENPYDRSVTVHGRESLLADGVHQCESQVKSAMNSYRVYHFHDTSDTAPVKSTCNIDDNRYFRPQGENLAAFLYWMQEKQPAHFKNILLTIQQIAPFFKEFHLEPKRLNESLIGLEWREQGSDSYFDATYLSDGTLRFICLVTLLLQPEPLPVIFLDEPELGLHPAAIVLLAELMRSAAVHTQIIAATQSVTLVNQFDPEHVWTVERENDHSVFRHLARENILAWLDNYALGDLWEKNVLGARP